MTPVQASKKSATIISAIAEQQDDDKRITRLRKRTDEQLISLALQCLADEKDAQHEYDLIRQVLDERFPKEENEERLITKAGLATRTVTNSYSLLGKEDHEQYDSACKLKALLGKGYDTCVTETVEYAIPKHLYPDLVKALGKRSDEFVRQSTRYTLTAKFRRLFTDGGVDFSACVSHVRKHKIVVEPVGSN